MSASLTDGDARARARRQLNRVLLVLGGLDLSALGWVVAWAVVWARLRFPTLEFVAVILCGLVAILIVRLALAVRLRRRVGEI